MPFPTLDAHAHLTNTLETAQFQESGAVFAFTLSLEEASTSLKRQDQHILWGVGCHPRIRKAQENFNPILFEKLIAKTPIIGEIGLDRGSRVPMEIQIKNFRQILEIITQQPRIVSIHSFQATDLVLEELKRNPINTPILHWWTGSAANTTEAVKMGSYFSIHSAVARQSKFRTRVPIQRVLVESDHGYNDPPAAIPCRIMWAEQLVAQQYRLKVEDLRIKIWKNLWDLVQKTETYSLFPEFFQENFDSVRQITNLVLESERYE